jgi:hypothetical protein
VKRSLGAAIAASIMRERRVTLEVRPFHNPQSLQFLSLVNIYFTLSLKEPGSKHEEHIHFTKPRGTVYY